MKIFENVQVQAAIIVCLLTALGAIQTALILGQAIMRKKLELIHNEQATIAKQTELQTSVDTAANGQLHRDGVAKTRADDVFPTDTPKE